MRSKDREHNGETKSVRWLPSCAVGGARKFREQSSQSRYICSTIFPIPSSSSCGLLHGASVSRGSSRVAMAFTSCSPPSILRRFTGDEYSSSSELDAIFDSNAEQRDECRHVHWLIVHSARGRPGPPGFPFLPTVSSYLFRTLFIYFAL